MLPDETPDGHGVADEWPPGEAPAQPWRRVVARLVDGLIIAAVAAAIAVVGAALSGGLLDQEPGAEPPVWIFYVSFLVGAIYEIAFIARSGQTPAKRLLQVRVVSMPSGGVPEVSAAVIRWFVVAGIVSLPSPPGVQLLLVIVVAGVCLVPMFTRADRRGLHDRFSATAAVAAPPVPPPSPWA
ncbi:MAG TPA: RDD family protein [Acidimicrobiales bacterium]|nr:RDD family protein [Acidimicrobiales bacterium]